MYRYQWNNSKPLLVTLNQTVQWEARTKKSIFEPQSTVQCTVQAAASQLQIVGNHLLFIRIHESVARCNKHETFIR